MIEKILDILSKAMEKNPNNPLLTLLYFKYTEMYNKSGDTYKIMKDTFSKFKMIYQENNIFMAYLDYLFSSFQNYS